MSPVAESPQAVLSPDFLKTVARKPGVYLMRDEADQVLYVGKARELRKRLTSYARHAGAHPAKTAMMLSKVRRIDTIITHTEKEALILESSLIKKHRPRYNVILRDDKNYPLIKVTVGEKWPRVLMTRRRMKDGSRYFGPFSSPSAMWETLNYLNSLFPLRRCKGKELKNRDRPCLNYQMGRCLAPCAGKVDPETYQEMVRNIIMVLDGKKEQLVNKLRSLMINAAEAMKFEEAAVCRDRITALEKTLEKQVMVAVHNRDQDVFGFVRQGTSVAIAIIFVRNGVVHGRQTFFLLEPVGEDPEILTQVLERYYGDDRPVPQEVLLPFQPEDMETLNAWLTEMKGVGVRCAVPKRGDRLKLMRMSTDNAAQVFADRRKKKQSWDVLATALKKTLHLSRLPARIECLDISNIGGDLAVGSLVCFVGGEKEKSKFRHYKIRSVEGPDDYAMMAEVLDRRLRKGAEQDDLPDFLLVDGGKGQLNVATVVVNDLGLQDAVDLAGIAKEKEGEGEKLYRPGRKNPILLARHSPVLLFLMRIRDEAHRYGITFHRKWRHKVTLRSMLGMIPGIGPARQKTLLKELGSLKRIKNASPADLARVPGIGPELAEQVWEHFHK